MGLGLGTSINSSHLGTYNIFDFSNFNLLHFHTFFDVDSKFDFNCNISNLHTQGLGTTS